MSLQCIYIYIYILCRSCAAHWHCYYTSHINAFDVITVLFKAMHFTSVTPQASTRRPGNSNVAVFQTIYMNKYSKVVNISMTLVEIRRGETTDRQMTDIVFK